MRLNSDDPDTPVEEVIECMNEVRKAGKIRVFGVSNWTHERIAEANAYAASKGKVLRRNRMRRKKAAWRR